MKAGWRVRRIATGSGIVRKRLGRALVPLAEDGEIRLIASALRCGPLVVAAPNMLTLAHQSPALLVGGTCAWCLAAWRSGGEQATAAEEKQDEAEETPAPADPADLRQAVADRLLDWIGTRPGIPIAEVYERYRTLPGHEALTDSQIRTALTDHYRIPVKAVRIGEKTPRGIHRDDLQPLPSPAAQAPVADACNTAPTSTVAA